LDATSEKLATAQRDAQELSDSLARASTVIQVRFPAFRGVYVQLSSFSDLIRLLRKVHSFTSRCQTMLGWLKPFLWTIQDQTLSKVTIVQDLQAKLSSEQEACAKRGAELEAVHHEKQKLEAMLAQAGNSGSDRQYKDSHSSGQPPMLPAPTEPQVCMSSVLSI